MAQNQRVRVLFVCLGNICRSPMAEIIFRDKVQRAGLDDVIEIESGGTGSWHVGERPDRRAMREVERRGLSVGDMRARQISADDLVRADHVLAMDVSNLNTVRRMLRNSGVDREPRLLLEFIDDPIAPTEVPDPYYEYNFDYVFDLIDEATDGLLEYLVDTHALSRT